MREKLRSQRETVFHCQNRELYALVLCVYIRRTNTSCRVVVLCSSESILHVRGDYCVGDCRRPCVTALTSILKWTSVIKTFKHIHIPLWFLSESFMLKYNISELKAPTVGPRISNSTAARTYNRFGLWSKPYTISTNLIYTCAYFNLVNTV